MFMGGGFSLSSKIPCLGCRASSRLRVLVPKREAEKKFGKKNLFANMASNWDWGFVSGKLSAIRWVLGEDWDMLDT